MIVGISGDVVHNEPTFLHIDANGLVYQVNISLNCNSQIKTKQIKLHTTYIVKEDSQSLYGFFELNEKKLFDTVIKINGVGPKVALAICSTFTPKSFATIVSNKDVDMLKKVPGIGTKGASRILVELSGFVVDGEQSSESVAISEAMLALESLGFNREKIQKILTSCESSDTSSLVKEALKRL